MDNKKRKGGAEKARILKKKKKKKKKKALETDAAKCTKLSTFFVKTGGSDSTTHEDDETADFCQLTLDPNTANRELSLSEENRKATHGVEQQPYPDLPQRFDCWPQVLCMESLTGRCYWEVEWSGNGAEIGVTYEGFRRKGKGYCSWLGFSDKSWILYCSPHNYSVRHNKKQTVIPIQPSGSQRVGVYLDCAAGALSFYRVSSKGLTILHSFTSSFTEPLYPAFCVYANSSVSMCMLG